MRKQIAQASGIVFFMSWLLVTLFDRAHVWSLAPWIIMGVSVCGAIVVISTRLGGRYFPWWSMLFGFTGLAGAAAADLFLSLGLARDTVGQVLEDGVVIVLAVGILQEILRHPEARLGPLPLAKRAE